MRTLILLVCSLAALTACSVAHKATLPDGSQGFVISKCRDLSNCYNRAAELCGGKYEILNQGTVNQGAIFGNNGTVSGAMGSSHEITVKCPK